MTLMSYAELLKSYIEQSKMTLDEISKKISELGLTASKQYLSKLQNGKTPPASEKLNNALAEILDGDAMMLELWAYIDKSPDAVKALLSNFDNEVLEILVKLNEKYPNATIDLLGENEPDIENSEELKIIREHTSKVISDLIGSGKSDFFNEKTMLELKDRFDGLFEFDEYENEIRDTLKSKGFGYTVNFIEKLIYKDLSNDELSLQIQDKGLLEWYLSLPNFGEKKLKKLKKLWDMMEE